MGCDLWIQILLFCPLLSLNESSDYVLICSYHSMTEWFNEWMSEPSNDQMMRTFAGTYHSIYASLSVYACSQPSFNATFILFTTDLMRFLKPFRYFHPFIHCYCSPELNLLTKLFILQWNEMLDTQVLIYLLLQIY